MIPDGGPALSLDHRGKCLEDPGLPFAQRASSGSPARVSRMLLRSLNSSCQSSITKLSFLG
jgi:hypothetical protein